MAFDSPINTFDCKKVDPVILADLAGMIDVNLSPNLTIARGTVLAQVGASANDVQTLSMTGTPTGGSISLQITNPLSQSVVTLTVNSNATAAAVQSLCDSNFGTGNFTVAGGPLPGSALTFTGANDFAAMAVAPFTVSANNLTGGASPAASVAHTTQGASAGSFAPYSSAVAAVPANPTLTATGTGSAFAAGTYLVQVTGVNANGETTPTAEVPITLTVGQKIQVNAITGLDTSITSLNVYVDGSLVGSCVASAGTSTATAFDVASVTVKGTPPRSNTAYTAANGLWNPRAIAPYDYASDAAALVTYGTTSLGNELGVKVGAVPVYVKGIFDVTTLVGLDANAVAGTTGVMRMFQGTVSGPGMVELT